MNYKSFNNTKNKISKLWEQNNNIDILLKQKENILQKYFRENSITLTSKILYDSDWIGVKPSQSSSITTTILKNPLPTTILYNTLIDLENFPEDFLPFVQLEVLFKTIPEVYIDTSLLYEIRQLGSNYVEVKGDGEIIWKGTVASMSDGHKLNQEQIDSSGVPLSHLKASWRSTMYWTEGGNNYRIVNGAVWGFDITHDTSLSCSPPNNNYKRIRGEMYPETYNIAGNNGYQNGIINDLSLTHINCTGRELEVLWGGIDCDSQITEVDNITRSLDWNSVFLGKLKVIGDRQRWNGSSWVTDITGGTYLDVGYYWSYYYDIDMTTIDTDLSIIIEPTEYYHFYSSQKRWLFWINNTTPYNLQNLPHTANPVVILPYTEITFDLNNGDNPPDTVIPDLIQSSENDSLFWHKTADLGNGFGNFRFKSIIRGVGVTQATIPTPSNFDVFNDGYTIVGNTYSKTIISHATKIKNRYSSSLEDIQLRIRLNFQNPYTFFRETRVTHD